VLLADHLGELLRTVFARQDDVTHVPNRRLYSGKGDWPSRLMALKVAKNMAQAIG
jgi:hypothetical protein